MENFDRTLRLVENSLRRKAKKFENEINDFFHSHPNASQLQFCSLETVREELFFLQARYFQMMQLAENYIKSLHNILIKTAHKYQLDIHDIQDNFGVTVQQEGNAVMHCIVNAFLTNQSAIQNLLNIKLLQQQQSNRLNRPLCTKSR